MIAKNKTSWLAGILLISMSASVLRAQDIISNAFGDSDLQFFSPVNFDFADRPIRADSGYFFTYDKLYWAATGERVPVGNQNVTYQAQSPLTGGLVPGVAPAPFTIVNGISDSAPFATFAGGSRFEFGKFDKNSGWQVTVTNGPEFVSADDFGFGVNSNAAPALPTTGVTPPTTGVTTLTNGFGFGSVHIGFTTTSPDYFVGFVSLLNSTPGEGTSTSQVAGPGIGGQLIDDVDGDGVFSLGDTIQFFPVWEQVSIRNMTSTDGFELMRTLQLDNSHQLATRQGSQWGFGYGVRFFRLRDRFNVDALGGVFGDSSWHTEIDNQIIGPQAQLQWQKQEGRWNLNAQGRFTAGYNIQNMGQTARIGSDLVPGGQNKPIFADPTVSNAGKRGDEFSPLAEIRVNASYQLSRAISVRLGYTAIFINGIRRAANQVNYSLPNMGFRDGGTQDIFINGANFGFDVVY